MPEVSQSLGETIEAFLTSKRVGGLSSHTLDAYQRWLYRFIENEGAANPLAVRKFIAGLQERRLKPSSVHTAYRTLKTFFRWALTVEALRENPLRGFSLRVPRTLPRVPTEDDVRAILRKCTRKATGRRNRALILVFVDAGLRASEVIRLLIEDWKHIDRSLFIRSGKGQKDRIAFLSPATARALRSYLGTRQLRSQEDFLFADSQNQPLKRRHLVQILHRLSKRAGLPRNRRIHPHALRHFAATSWLRYGLGLDEVRRLLGHESLSTTLRYSALVSSDLQAAHKKVSAVERMRLD